jgi:hypothetical protein
MNKIFSLVTLVSLLSTYAVGEVAFQKVSQRDAETIVNDWTVTKGMEEFFKIQTKSYNELTDVERRASYPICIKVTPDKHQDKLKKMVPFEAESEGKDVSNSELILRMWRSVNASASGKETIYYEVKGVKHGIAMRTFDSLSPNEKSKGFCGYTYELSDEMVCSKNGVTMQKATVPTATMMPNGTVVSNNAAMPQTVTMMPNGAIMPQQTATMMPNGTVVSNGAAMPQTVTMMPNGAIMPQQTATMMPNGTVISNGAAMPQTVTMMPNGTVMPQQAATVMPNNGVVVSNNTMIPNATSNSTAAPTSTSTTTASPPAVAPAPTTPAVAPAPTTPASAPAASGLMQQLTGAAPAATPVQ